MAYDAAESGLSGPLSAIFMAGVKIYDENVKKALTSGRRYGNLTKLSAGRRLVRPAGRSMKNVKKVEKVVDKMAGI